MDEQIVQAKLINQGLTLGAIALGVVILGIMISIYMSPVSDPYIQEVLAVPGDASRGAAMFEINCAACHGLEANGNVGPSLQGISKHKSKAHLIHQVISGETPPMPKFQPNKQEMADLLKYLEKL